jgi:hypothetical protein
MTHPQDFTGLRDTVDQCAVSSTAWGHANEGPTWENAAFSTIHTAYYCYWSYLLNTKKS